MNQNLMGACEVAEYLGWPGSRVAQYARSGYAGILEPIAHLHCGRIWRRSDIEEWARERGYRV